MPTRPCWAEIDLAAFAHNLRLLQRTADASTLAATVKADAYGHSIALCAPAAVEAGASWLAVTSTDEALTAARACAEVVPRILVLSGPFPGDGEAVAAYGFTCSVWQREHLQELHGGALQCGRSELPVHLEIDTGMSRQGVAPEDQIEFLETLCTFPTLRLDGVMTHLYAADESGHAATQRQLKRLADSLCAVRERGFAPAWLSVGNSAALLDRDLRSQLAAMASRHGLRLLLRPGIALYGVPPEYDPQPPESAAASSAGLLPVLRWKTRVTSLRRIAPGEVVGYNGSFQATQPMRLALLAVGYADGLSRRLSHRGHALVAGLRAPYAGRISMDQAVLDVTGVPEERLRTGDEVVLLGRQGDSVVTAEDHARWAETIPWEIFTAIAARVPRIAAG